MSKFLLAPVTICLILLGCAGTAPTPQPTFSVAPERLKDSPPAPQTPSDGKASEVIQDPVKIEPKAAVGFQNLPTSVTEIFDRPPHDVSSYDVVAETLANNRQIKIQGYNLRIAEYQVPVSKGIYDLLLGASTQYTQTDQQTGMLGLGTLPVNKARSWAGQASLQQLLPSGATFNLAYTAVRTVSLVNEILPVVNPVTGATTFAANNVNIRTYSNNTVFNITQPLLNGFGPQITNAPIRIAQLEQKGAAADFQTNIETQLIGSLQTYWELIGALESYKVQVISYAAARDLLRVNTAKFNAGVVAKTEVLQAEAAAEARRELLIQARQAVRNLEDQLKRQIFLQKDAPMWGVEIRPTQPIAWRELNVDLDQSIQVAFANRSEMRRARSNIDQNEVNKMVAKNQLLPSLNLFGQAQPNAVTDDFGDSADTMTDGKYVNYNAGLQFSYPLQNRAAKYRLKQADARAKQANESLLDLQDQITLDVRQAVRDLKTARERIDVTQSQIRSAQATLDAERKRLDVGISTSFQVLQFQQDVATAQDQHIRAVVDYNEAAFRLERARGTLLGTYGVQVEGANLKPEPKPVVWPVGFN